MLWLKTFYEIRWMVMSRINEIKTGFLMIDCPKRGKLGRLGYNYPPETNIHFQELGGSPFPDLIGTHLHRDNRRALLPHVAQPFGQVASRWR